MSRADGPTRTHLDLNSPESPRWHGGAFWFSDYYRKTVNRMVLGQPSEVVLQLDDAPAALGFMPDGGLLIASMRKRQLLRWRDGRLSLHADLRGLPGEWLNDMVVDGDGRAYVGTRSTKVSPAVHYREPGGPDSLIVVEPDGESAAPVEQICSPNGAVITPDGRSFIMAEIYARRIVRFDRDPQGRLSGKRVLVEFEHTWPDGICLDAEGAVWACSPYSGEVVGVLSSGEVAQRYSIPGAVACMLGGEGRRTLFIVATDVRRLPSSDPSKPHGSLYMGPGHDTGLKRSPDDPAEVDTSGLYMMEVDVPGAGWP
ncbi:MAG TPA: SMP-30/gluconolactonase/LRE family protein [Phenylobacterium sp.]|uniref:SMP-30/gluconolactonase/LRE family protein n=1 Tax=Phenylobacterium sp. TaxID=1871053 RepID=UPI002B48D676|nr:SMP-30/gluconolactonase/LRE family protein [Phenylobacterium sp.]HKR87460.1 SMP-30/gluconolactonase/LRE family protein [Phenylobacterium sp.]HKT54019.1 SMP-30/gluconolactonase/LRE family protein [Caulobacteraceae bacterium]